MSPMVNPHTSQPLLICSISFKNVLGHIYIYSTESKFKQALYSYQFECMSNFIIQYTQLSRNDAIY